MPTQILGHSPIDGSEMGRTLREELEALGVDVW
jgi:hypothetical protein